MVVTGDGAVKERIDSERNQGRAPDMDWLDHDRLGFNYRLSDLACAVGIQQLKRLDVLLEARRDVAELYEMALADLPLELPLPRQSWFVYVVRLPRGVDRNGTIEKLRQRGVASKPYLPAIHLFSFYRERFGYREGQFPVAEDAGARSLALPFFPGLTEGEIDYVARALAEVL
jgi:perosamine synthetase